MDYLLLIVGLVLLIVGADGLVKGASRLAASFGIPSLVIGLTVVAFGTSAPEVAVSIRSTLAGQTEMAIANVVGSNIFNILFILGIASVITPLAISKQLIRQDVPIMAAVSLLVFYMAQDGLLSVWDAVVLVGLLIGYNIFLFVQGMRTEKLTKAGPASVSEDDALKDLTQSEHATGQSILWVVMGLTLLIAGAELLVSSAVSIARIFSVSEAVIGLTILAIGTSLPEVTTSIVASIKGQRDIAVGNVVGSNIFNLLAVLGISGLLSGQGLLGNVQLVQRDFPIMLAVTFLCLPLFFTGASLSRVEGAWFFTLYLIYTAFLIGTAIGAIWLGSLTTAIWYIIAPATVLLVLGSLLKDMLAHRKLKLNQE